MKKAARFDDYWVPKAEEEGGIKDDSQKSVLMKIKYMQITHPLLNV